MKVNRKKSIKQLLNGLKNYTKFFDREDIAKVKEAGYKVVKEL